jgi:RNA polymerase sigma-70 factor (ECF subfamily)
MHEFAHRADPSPEADAEVVRRIRNGDREAFRIVVLRYQDLLYRTALRHVQYPDVAADLVQAAYVKAYTNIWRCRDPERFGAWLYRILVNGAKDYLKSRRRSDVSLDDPDTPKLQIPAPSNPERELDRTDARGRIERALAELPDTMREAFLLKHVEGRAYEDIAEMLGVSVPALKMRVHRARAILRELMERDDA